MSDKKSTQAAVDARSPWVFDSRELGRRAGASRAVRRTISLDSQLGLPGIIVIPQGAEVELDVLFESVIEGVLATGGASAVAQAECARCLDPIEYPLEVDFTELFAYPDSTTDATTDEDEVYRLVDSLVDVEPVVRDACVLALPQVPLCREDCPGLCTGCGVKWVDLEPDHGHETIDPRWAALVEHFHDVPAVDPDNKA